MYVDWGSMLSSPPVRHLQCEMLDTAGAKLRTAILERETDPQERTLFVTLVLFMITRCPDHNNTCCEVYKV